MLILRRIAICFAGKYVILEPWYVNSKRLYCCVFALKIQFIANLNRFLNYTILEGIQSFLVVYYLVVIPEDIYENISEICLLEQHLLIHNL